MIKRIALLARRADLDRAAFRSYWRTTHAEIVCRAPGIRAYVQNHVVRELGDAGDLSVDGIVELWFDDAAAMQGWAAAAARAGYLEDEPKFMRGVSLFLAEAGAPPRPAADAVKLMIVDPPAAGALPGVIARGTDRLGSKAFRASLPLGQQDAESIETCWLESAAVLEQPAWRAALAGRAAYLIEDLAVVSGP